jgi:hypothetical protein
MILLTDEAERVITKLKKNFGNAEMIFQKLHSDIATFDHVTNFKSFLEFTNLVENITITIKSFVDGADTPHKRHFL